MAAKLRKVGLLKEDMVCGVVGRVMVHVRLSKGKEVNKGSQWSGAI
jgi:hypothetical protein